MALLSNITLSIIVMFILIVAGYLISAFFDLEIQYYMPYLLWFLALCIFNMFLDKTHVNIYDKKSISDDESNMALADDPKRQDSDRSYI